MAYILWKFQADSLKIEARRIQTAEEFFSEQKTCADLNCWAIDPKFLYVVVIFMAYILLKFEADSSKIEAWRKNSAENITSPCCSQITL